VTDTLVSRISHVALRVTDLQRSIDFAVDTLGLFEVERVGDAAYLSCSDRHHELELIESDTAGCDHVAFEAASIHDLDRLRDRLVRAGVDSLDETAEPGVDASLRFVGPGGMVMQACVGMGENHAPRGAAPVRPRKLGHFTLKAEEPRGLEAFLTNALGLRLSDRIGNMLLWMRCNPEHHGVGVATGPNGLHHYAFELEDWAALKSLGDHMISRGGTYLWGPGRHGPGNNLFAYVVDPDGAVVEVFADILRIESETTYRPRDWPDAPTSLNQWGPLPPPEWFEARHPFAPAATRAGTGL
jgi:catechol-2,3-dioxygenase